MVFSVHTDPGNQGEIARILRGCNSTVECSPDKRETNVRLIPSLLFLWARSLLGRAPGLHPEDRRFDACRVHLFGRVVEMVYTPASKPGAERFAGSTPVLTIIRNLTAALAQLVERVFRKHEVSGSLPESGSLCLRSSIGRASAF